MRTDGNVLDLTGNGADLYVKSNTGNTILQQTSGIVGIRTSSPSFTLHVNGSAGKPGGGSWSSASDARLKKNIRALEGSLGRLLELRGVTFEYKEPEKIHELPGERIGMIAQQVEQVFPDWVDVGEDGYRRQTIRGFEALAVEALRELRQEKDAEIAAVRAKNLELEARLDRLEALIEGAAASGPSLPN